MLQDQVILEYLQYGEEHLAHNIFSSVAVIHTFATKCKNREVRRFVVGALLDAVRTGILEAKKHDFHDVIGVHRSETRVD